MITRIIMLMLIAVLALPVATLTPSGDSGQRSWDDLAVEAKGKKSKKAKKPKIEDRHPLHPPAGDAGLHQHQADRHSR